MRLIRYAYIIIFIAMLNQSVLAQWQLKTDITTGYEHNIFRNPKQLIKRGNLLGTDELYNNSAYTEVFMRFAYKKELERSRYRIKANISNTRYFSENDAQRYTFEFKGDYRLRMASKKYLQISPRLYRRLRLAELEENDAIFRTPYAYVQVDVPVSIDFYLRKLSWLKIQPLYTFRQYDQTTFSNRLRYHAWFVQFLFKKRWQNPKAEHKVEMAANIGTRYYRDTPALSTSMDEELLDPERRIWHYAELEMKYKVEFADGKVALSIPLRYINRYDQIPNAFSFQEQSLGVELKLKDEGFLLVPSVRYSRRNYAQILGDQDLLKYDLIFGRLYYKKRLSPIIETTFKVDWNFRLSNRKRLDTRYFRGYNNYLIEAGIMYKLK